MYCGYYPMRHRHRHAPFFASAEFGPWGRKRHFFEAGEVRLALLSLLADGPRHGYELMKEIEARSGGVYRTSAGTVYPTLQQLEDEGLVTSQSDGGKRVYSITDKGRSELEESEPAVSRIWRRAEHWQEWSGAGTEATEVAGPLRGLLRAALRASARGDAETVRRIRDILERTRNELEALSEK
jgi:DNA-binding PadR family transcriptional regulator